MARVHRAKGLKWKVARLWIFGTGQNNFQEWSLSVETAHISRSPSRTALPVRPSSLSRVKIKRFSHPLRTPHALLHRNPAFAVGDLPRWHPYSPLRILAPDTLRGLHKRLWSWLNVLPLCWTFLIWACMIYEAFGPAQHSSVCLFPSMSSKRKILET